MSPFEPGGGIVPPAPVDIPIPDVPSANFTTIGKQASDGLAAGGYVDSWLRKFIAALVDMVATIVAALIGLLEAALAKLLGIVFKVLNQSEAGANLLAATVLSGMTGISVSDSQFSNSKDRGSREDTAVQLVALLQTSLAKGATKDANGVLQPGSAGAEEFLKIVAHMGIEGWLLGFMTDTFSAHLLEHVGDLKEVIEQSLGLGRLARRALGAPMKVLVEDPYTWLLNRTYLPTRLSAGEQVREYLRTTSDRVTLNTKLAELGHSPANIDALINLTRAHLSPAQIVDLLFHAQLDSSTATQLLNNQGFDNATANLFILAQENARNDGFARERVRQAFADFDARLITQDSAQSYIDASGLPAGEKSALTSTLQGKALHQRRLLSLAQGEQLVEAGLWNFDQFRELAREHGYSTTDETSLELLLLLKSKKATDSAAAKKAAADARAASTAARLAAAQEKIAHATEIIEAHGVSIARYETLVQDGLRSIAQYKSFLVGKGIASDNIDALATVLQGKLDRASHGATVTPALAAAAKQKQLDLAQLERAVLAGHMSRAEYQQRISALGFDSADVTILVELLDDKIAAAAAKGSAKTGASNTLKARGVSLANEDRATRLGLQTIAQYSAFLDSHGFPPEDRDLLVHLMQAQLVSDDQARAVRGQVAGQMQARGLSLRELEQAVRAGVRSIDAYKLQLSKAGYDSATQEALVDVLTLHMQQDEASLILHGHAAALLGEQGLSLSEIEAGVKFGTKTLPDYAAALTQAGLAPADVEVLRMTLAAKLKIDPGTSTTGG